MESYIRQAPESEKRALRVATDLLSSSESVLMQEIRSILGRDVAGKFDALRRGPQAAKSMRISLDSLSLVDDFEMQETIALSKLEKRIKEEVEYEHYALARRVETLVENESLSDAENPFYTGVFCKALLEALGEIGLVQRGKLTAFAAFEASLLLLMPDLYARLNAELADIGILVEVPAPHEGRIKRTDSHPGTIGHAGITLSEATHTQAQGIRGAGVNASQENAALSEWGQLPANAAFKTLSSNVRPGSLTLAQADKPAPELSIAIRKMQMLAVPMPGAVDLGLTMPIPIAHTEDGIARLCPTAIESLERKFSEYMRPIDVAVTRLVHRIFERLLADDEMPWALKDLLAQMQMPALRVAMEEPAVLGNEHADVWQFMNRVIEIGVCLGPHFTAGTPIHEHVATVVQFVVTQFDDDTLLFRKAAEHLDVAIGVSDELAAEGFAEAVAGMEFDEKRLNAIEIGQYEVKHRIAETNYPASTADLIVLYWGRLLAKDFLEEGEGRTNWTRDLASIDEIVTCARAASFGDRDVLRSKLPTLLGQIQTGLDRLRVPSAEREAFVQELVAHLSSVAQGGGLASSSLHRASSAVTTDDIRDPRTIFAASTDEVGQWMLSRDNEGAINRLRLLWKSPHLRSYLLKDYVRNEPVKLSGAEWARKIGDGSLKKSHVNNVLANILGSVMHGEN